MTNRIFARTIVATMVIFISALPVSSAFAGKKGRRGGALRTFGDYAQIINPVVAGGVASKEKGLGHFLIIYGESLVITHATKFIASSQKLGASKRPTIANKRDRYDGMPSGHTNSAWFAASYIRNFSTEYSYLAVPLYVTAAITGFSRVKSKEHTSLQVVSGAVLAEIVNIFNSKLAWSDNYRAVKVSLSPKGGSLGFKFNF